MKMIAVLGASLLVLAACDAPVPDSGAGVGLNSAAQNAQRDATLRGAQVAPTATLDQSGAIARPVSTQVAPSTGVSSADLAAAGINTGQAQTSLPEPAPVATAPLAANPEISDEQNFQAVAGRETIESDAERRARQAAAYQLMEVTALPNRPGDAGPNIVQYALQAPNDRGEAVFNRSSLSGEGRFLRNCAKYATPDDAQRDFLARGGPQRDRLGIDPDGDGFACGWDPQAFRALASGN